MGLQEQGWVMDIIRGLFSILDKLVYSLVKWILFGIFDLANLTTNSEVFSGIYSRIYVVLGIFMAFKLSFSFFQYIIDPESMTGKSDKSLSKIFMRVFVMLAALIVLPTFLFGRNGEEGLLAKAQRAFLPTLPRVIFGVDDIGGLSSSTSSDQFTDSIEQASNDITITTLKGFFATPEDIDTVCGSGTYDSIPPIENLDEFSANVNLTCNRVGEIQLGVGPIHTGTRYYKYSYMWFISTIVGVLIAVLLLSITLDLAKRLFKLMILEVIAPVPIMSLIDPKGSKDGAFSKWLKSLSSTFLDIFFKLGLVYIIVVFIHLIVDSVGSGKLFNNFPQNAGFRGTYLTILLILGLIFFAKEAPKFIKDAMGIKGEGNGLFDDVKSIGKAAGLVGGAALGTVSAVSGNTSAAVAAFKNGHVGQGVGTLLNTAGAGVVGGVKGGINGASGANKGNPLKGWGNAVSKQQGVNANKIANASAGSSVVGRTGARFSNFFTGETASDRDERRIAAYKEVADSAKTFKTTLADSAGKSDQGFNISYKNKVTGKEFKSSSNVTLKGFKGTLAAANSGDATAIADLSKYGFSSLAEANEQAAAFEKEYQKAYYGAVVSGAIDRNSDGDAAAVMSAKSVADRKIKGLGLKDIAGNPISEVNAGNSGAVIGSATTESNKIVSGKKYTSHKRSAAAVKGKSGQ